MYGFLLLFFLGSSFANPSSSKYLWTRRLDRHFNIGDEIETMKHRGEIIDVTLRKTRLKTCDGTIVVLPNGKNRFFWMGVTQEKD